LNRAGRPTTIVAVRQHLIRNCPYVAPPSADMVKQTVANLTATGLVYKMGEHLFVSVPTQTQPKNKVSLFQQHSGVTRGPLQTSQNHAALKNHQPRSCALNSAETTATFFAVFRIEYANSSIDFKHRNCLPTKKAASVGGMSRS
uniref:Stork_head domain-containing protein n=1 Tax=Heligmosomoides polygyrus TaxID=6339 RepID=A0A183GMM7_HELPZ